MEELWTAAWSILLGAFFWASQLLVSCNDGGLDPSSAAPVDGVSYRMCGTTAFAASPCLLLPWPVP